MSELKSDIIKFIANNYSIKGVVPSLRDIVKAFKPSGLSFTDFYKIFPGRLAEACTSAGVPVPQSRINRMRKVKRLQNRDRSSIAASIASNKIVLSDALSNRLQAISHLENGRPPLKVLEELFNLDALFRKSNLTLSKRLVISNIIENALRRNWPADQFAEYVTRLYNTGIIDSQPENVLWLLSLCEEVKSRKWDIKNFTEYLTKIANLDLLNQPPAVIKGLVTLAKAAEQNKFTIPKFVEYATRHFNETQAYYEYMEGKLSYEDFRRIMEECLTRWMH